MSSTLVQEWAVILTLPKEDSRPKRCLSISSESIQGREKRGRWSEGENGITRARKIQRFSVHGVMLI